MRLAFPLLALPLLLAACAGKGADDTGAWDPSTFPGGSFIFTSTAVDDACLDGAFTALFLPEGDGTTSDWAYPVELPAWSSLPASYAVQLQEPFSSMDVTVTAGGSDGTLVVDGAAQTGVEFDADAYPGCLVDMDITVDITLDDDDTAHGVATLATSSFDEANCPVVAQDPCGLTLDFLAARE